MTPATHPLKRLRHVGRVIFAGARDPHVPRHLGFEVAASVEEARAQTIHGRGATIGVVDQPAMPADPDRGARCAVSASTISLRSLRILDCC